MSTHSVGRSDVHGASHEGGSDDARVVNRLFTSEVYPTEVRGKGSSLGVLTDELQQQPAE